MGEFLFYIRSIMRWILTFLIFLFAAPAMALELGLPVACEMGKTCWVQQYVDHDAGPGAADFTCGIASYDGHDGTDIRALNTRADIAVVAAASGRVKAVRDGVADRLMKSEADRAAVAKIECGNGLVVTHDGGWETQYCHMRKGSVAVKAGDTVAKGDRLGLVGYSGAAAFPHVHITVRKDGKVIDPFSADTSSDCKAADRSLWSATAQEALAYTPTQLLQLSWTPRIYDDDEVEAGALAEFQPANWTALVLFAEAINLYKDDVMTLTVSLPDQDPVVNRLVMQRNRAVQRLYAGKKLKATRPSGVYTGRMDITRGHVVVLTKDISFELKNQ
jgi:murein DD-endopeptidase MepM/ murein hydrolase activator NlpD